MGDAVELETEMEDRNSKMEIRKNEKHGNGDARNCSDSVGLVSRLLGQ